MGNDHEKPVISVLDYAQGGRRKHNPSLAVLGFFCGAGLALVCIVSSLMIWICLFDSDGGEPGASTTFGLIPFLPVLGMAILGCAIASAASKLFFVRFALVTAAIAGIAALLMVIVSLV